MNGLEELKLLEKMTLLPYRVLICMDVFDDIVTEAGIILPAIGHATRRSSSGIVKNIAPDVTEVKVGERVVFDKYITDNPVWCQELGKKEDGHMWIILDISKIYAVVD